MMDIISFFCSSMPIVAFLTGLAAIIFGSDILVDGSCSIARKSGISEFVIGLTIVGFGTSCPELIVSLTGALQGNADISIGNVIGSNIFNTLLILGLTALILPIGITKTNLSVDIPLTLFVSLVFVFLALYQGNISRFEGVLFLLLFSAYLYYCFKSDTSAEENGGDSEKVLSTGMSVFVIVLGLMLLVSGGKMFVDSAVVIARNSGVSDKTIAITLLAGGTSFPELATCIVAAIKKKGQLALGNILGSNVFNILLILGVSSLVTPLSTAGLNLIDMGVLVLSATVLMACAVLFRKNMLDRVEGALMTIMWIAYIAYLIRA